MVVVMVPTLMSADEEAESTHSVDDIFFQAKTTAFRHVPRRTADDMV